MAGKLYVTGIGPGNPAGMTAEAADALQHSDLIVGYKTYNELVRPHYPDKEYMETPMTGEEARCQLALREASRGRTVSLICSGDPGVYGMAGLVLEMAGQYPDVEVHVISGVTAAMCGAALLGAPLIHDFAVISLSDRLTPWETIRRRLVGAAQSDMVIVLYNPASKGRSDYLSRAAQTLMDIVPGDRVCGIAERIGRKGESTRIMTLSQLADARADMFCTVFVGNSTTKLIDGKIVTPRGYRSEINTPNGSDERRCEENDNGIRKEQPVLIFAGTTEGRALTKMLSQRGVRCLVSVATQYGAELLGQEQCTAQSGTESPRSIQKTVKAEDDQRSSVIPGEHVCGINRNNMNISILQGRMDAAQMADVIRENNCVCVADTTHPFAVQVSEEIRKACEETGVPYYRLRRKTEEEDRAADMDFGTSAGNIFYVTSVREAAAKAAELLQKTEGSIFLTTGSKDLPELVAGIGDPARIYARVLPTAESLRICEDSGLLPNHIIAMQGPFSRQINEAMLRETGAAVMLTKESGRAGGFDEKIQAAQALGIKLIVIRNPESGKCAETSAHSPADHEHGHIFTDCGVLASHIAQLLCGESGLTTKHAAESRQITLAGMGPGGADYILPAALEALESADVIFGAPSVLERLRHSGAAVKIPQSTPLIAEYRAERVMELLQNMENPGKHAAQCRAVVLFSGDTGFFSGASSFVNDIRSLPDLGQRKFDICILPGISSVSVFAARLGVSVSGTEVLSSHGRSCNLIGHLRRSKAVFLLLDGLKGLHEAAAQIQDAIEQGVLPAEALYADGQRVQPVDVGRCISGIRVGFGYQLTMPEEEAGFCTLAELSERKAEGLYILYVENPSADGFCVTPGLPDEAFVRGRKSAEDGRTCAITSADSSHAKNSIQSADGGDTGTGHTEKYKRTIPMTKEEVRAVSLSRLRLTPHAVLWDIGAGTGSVSVEAARLCPDGEVYAIEREAEATELIRKNIRRFGVSNVHVVEAQAPEGLKAPLPVPTHVFIGGSGGHLPDILSYVLARNPQVRIVINCITLETLSEAMTCLRTLPVSNISVRQISVARAREAGGLHLMRGQNPVFVIDCDGKG